MKNWIIKYYDKKNNLKRMIIQAEDCNSAALVIRTVNNFKKTKSITDQSITIKMTDIFKQKGYKISERSGTFRLSLNVSQKILRRAHSVKFIKHSKSGTDENGYFIFENNPICDHYKFYNVNNYNLTEKRRSVGAVCTKNLFQLKDDFLNTVPDDIQLDENKSCLELWYKIKTSRSHVISLVFSAYQERINGKIRASDIISSELYCDLHFRHYKNFFK